MGSPRLASLLAAVSLTGCGDGLTPPAEALVDATVDAPPPTASFTRHWGMAASQGQTVAFNGADGRLLATVVTDASGRAVGPMEPGGMISFVTPKFEIITVAGVAPGETVDYDETPDRPQPVFGDVRVLLPGRFPGAMFYDLTCGADRDETPTLRFDEPFLFPVHVGCGTDGLMDLIATAFDEYGTPIAHTSFLGRVPPSHDRTFDAVMPPWRTDWTRLQLEATELPPHANGVWLVPFPAGRSRTFLHRGYSGHAEPVIEGRSGPSRNVAPVTQELLLWTHVRYNGSDHLDLVQRAPQPPSGELRRELRGSELLPRITLGVITWGATGQPTVAWDYPSDPDVADTMMISLRQRNKRWRVLAPPNVRGQLLPTLPPAIVGDEVGWLELDRLALLDDADQSWDDRRLRPNLQDLRWSRSYRTSTFYP